MSQWKNKIREDPLLKMFDMERGDTDSTELDKKDIERLLEILKGSLRNKISYMKEEV